jgi:hypothetical protein
MDTLTARRPCDGGRRRAHFEIHRIPQNTDARAIESYQNMTDTRQRRLQRRRKMLPLLLLLRQQTDSRTDAASNPGPVEW